MAGGLAAVVPGPVDARPGRQVPVDLVFGVRGGHGALVGDQAGERSAAFAFDLRVDAHARGAAPTIVSDSQWPNCPRESTVFGRCEMGTRIGMRGVCVQLVVVGLVTMIFRV